MDNREIPMSDKKISIPVCDKVITLESGSDYTLPDYQPEAKKILYVKANPVQPAKYVSNASAEFSGNLEYVIFYVGADGEIYSVPVITEYEFETPFDLVFESDSDQTLSASADVYVENAAARLVGPRKINVRAKIKSHVSVCCITCTENLSAREATNKDVECLNATTAVLGTLHSVSDAIELSEEIIPEKENFRIVGADGNVFVTDVICNNDKANVKGEVYLTLLVSDTDNVGKTSTVQRRIPINADVDIEGMTPDCKCSAYGTISDISVNMVDGRIVCDISVILTANAQKPLTLSYTEDMYSTKNECTVSSKTYPVVCNGYCLNGNFSMNERFIKENISYPENANIIDVFGVASADSIETHNNKSVINGQVKYTLLLENDGEYTTNEVILPIRYEFESECEDITHATSNLSVVTCKARQDTESISIDAELAVSSWGKVYDEIKVACDMCLGEEINRARGELVIYYLRPDDTVWSVAKKYHVSRDELEAKNRTTDLPEYMII